MIVRSPLCIAFLIALLALTASPLLAQSGQIVGLGEKCVDVFQSGTDDGTPAVLWECTGNPNQQWSLEETGNPANAGQLYEIVGLGEKCLKPGPVGDSGFPEVEIGPCGMADAAWGASTLSGEFQLVHEETQLCLDVLGSNTENGTPLITFECRDQANQLWRLLGTTDLPAYFVPYVEVDRFNSTGVTTLFAVRNPGASSVTVRYEFYSSGDAPGFPDATQEIALAPGAVRTVDIRGVAGFVSSQGWVGISAIDPATGLPLASQDLYGDYFRLDQLNAFASGDRLLSRQDIDCSEWHMRYFNGGAFSGGTRFRLFVPEFDGPDPWTAIGRAYDEQGNLVQTFNTTSTNRTTTVVGTFLIEPFGVIEWEFLDGVKGHVSAVMDAFGEFSVGFQAECRD